MKKHHILFILLFLFSGNLFSQDFDIDEISKDVDRVITKDSITKVKKKKRKKAWDNRPLIPNPFSGLYVGVTSIVGDDYQSYDLNNKYEIGFFDLNSNYFGFQFAIRSSDLIYDDDYGDLNDSVWNVVYGRAFTSHGGILDGFFLKIAIGYHSYNYNTTEEFGAFYDIGDDFYADIGLRMFLLKLGGLGIIPEVNFDINGNMSYGIGIALEL